ncbi:MAG: hypothetical protein JKY34_07325 [Kordiimonadaceae bacterium]|nr:hypothetical protein [Kordiimonadaceae bacterium]
MVSYELVKWLSADAVLITMLATEVALHPGQLPENAKFPCLVLENERGGERKKNYGGLSNARTATRITLKVWAQNVGVLEKIVQHLILKMNGYTGLIEAVPRATILASVIARAPDTKRNLEHAIIDLNITNRS